MVEPRWERIKELVSRAAELSTSERVGFLERECGKSPQLRSFVESLLEGEPLLSGGSRRPDGAQDGESAPSRPEGPSDGSTTTATYIPLTEKEGTRIGPYKLLQQIGEGGFGVVFMADQESPVRRRVALKIIKLGMDTRRVVARFEAERQALAMMDHPNIAKVLDAGATESGRPYFVMELVRGVPITEYCDTNNLAAVERLDLFMPVCRAIQHAHTKGVIHRDIKPSNILVTLHDGRPVPKVIDFGIAKATDHRLTEKTLFTELRQLIGTPAYMSPEQAEMSGLDIDTRTDVYSLGVLLYELLTGTTPFAAEDLLHAGYGEMQRIIRETEPPRPSTRVSSLGSTEEPGGTGVPPVFDVAQPQNVAQPPSAVEQPISPKPSTFPSAAYVAARRRTEPKKLGLLLRGDLDWIVMKALEKDRTRRYETAEAFAADVQRHLSGEPVVAAPPSAAYRVRKFVRKHKGQVIAASAIASTLLIASIGMTIAWGIARSALDNAEGERRRAVSSERERIRQLERADAYLDEARIGLANVVREYGGEIYRNLAIAELNDGTNRLFYNIRILDECGALFLERNVDANGEIGVLVDAADLMFARNNELREAMEVQRDEAIEARRLAEEERVKSRDLAEKANDGLVMISEKLGVEIPIPKEVLVTSPEGGKQTCYRRAPDKDQQSFQQGASASSSTQPEREGLPGWVVETTASDNVDRLIQLGITAADSMKEQRDKAVLAQCVADEERAKAEHEAAEAHSQSETAEAVTKFLNEDMLASASAEALTLKFEFSGGRVEYKTKQSSKKQQEQKRDLLKILEDQLNLASKTGGRFSAKPLIEAGVRSALGSFLFADGQLEKAESQKRRALELFAAHQGLFHKDTLNARIGLARVYYEQQRWIEIQSLLEPVLQDSRPGKTGPYSVMYLLLIQAYLADGRPIDAASAIKNAINWSETSGDGCQECLLNIAMLVLPSIGHCEDAIQVAERTLKNEIARSYSQNKVAIGAKDQLGSLYAQCGQYVEAALILEECVADGRRRNAAPAWAVPNWLGVLAPTTKVLESVVSAASGADPAEFSWAIFHLGRVYYYLGEFDNAEELQREELSFDSEHFSEYPPAISFIKGYFGLTLLRLGKYEKAEKLFTKAIKTNKSGGPFKEYEDAVPEAGIGLVFSDRGQRSYADEHFRSALKILGEHPENTEWYFGLRDPELIDEIVQFYRVWDEDKPGRGFDREAKRWREIGKKLEPKWAKPTTQPATSQPIAKSPTSHPASAPTAQRQ